jgi:hypothetical protein
MTASSNDHDSRHEYFLDRSRVAAIQAVSGAGSRMAPPQWHLTRQLASAPDSRRKRAE